MLPTRLTAQSEGLHFKAIVSYNGDKSINTMRIHVYESVKDNKLADVLYDGPTVGGFIPPGEVDEELIKRMFRYAIGCILFHWNNQLCKSVTCYTV